MKLYKIVFALLFVLIPIKAFAMPAFPMAFWGTIIINTAPAPVGTLVKAYYGTDLAGQATVSEAGIYGYTEATKQKLIVAEGVGAITFTAQTPSLNTNVETTGDVPQTYTGFVSGETVNMNLAFQKNAPQHSSGGGGSGSGGGGRVATTVAPIATSTIPIIPALPSFSLSTASPESVVHVFIQTTKIGSRGNEVTELQKKLISQGYVLGKADGAFGPLTKKAVQAFQRKYLLIADGVVGPLTRKVLNL